MKACRGSRGIAPLILNLGARMGGSSSRANWNFTALIPCAVLHATLHPLVIYFINVPETPAPILEYRVVNYLTTCITSKGYIASSDMIAWPWEFERIEEEPVYIRLFGMFLDQTVETTGNHLQCSWCSWWDFERSKKNVLFDDDVPTEKASTKDKWTSIEYWWDRLCGLVIRVSGYRYRGLGFDSRRYQIFWVAVGLERGTLSLVRSIEELLE